MTTAILVVDRVTKRFAGHTAVDALSLTVPPGVIYGLLGPNGAGKSTTIRMIMGIYVPDAGAVRLFGDRRRRTSSHSERIGYLPEERGLYPKMRVLDVLLFLAEMKGMDRRDGAPEGAGVARAAGARRLAAAQGQRAVQRACSRRCSSSRPSCTTRISW